MLKTVRNHETKAWAAGLSSPKNRARIAVPYGKPGSSCHASQVCSNALSASLAERGLCRKVPKPPVTPSALSCNFSVSQVDVVAPTYQPSKAELDEDMRVWATFEEAVEALTQPVKVRYIPRPNRRPE